MKIIMLKNQAGSPDGLSVVVYQKNRRYDLPKALAEVFIEQGWASPANKSAVKTTASRKNQGRPPENKSAKKPSDKNK